VRASEPTGPLTIARAADGDASSEGRAGMRYRDLIPGRLGGRAIASLIRIDEGGPVPDYVHYHQVGFQMIFCRRGWVRVVYEDQGPPFVMEAGDCVLQPPTIRHRVLEASAGLEVVEVGCPAEHATWRDHALDLPTSQLRPGRVFGGQRFVRHVAAEAAWAPSEHPAVAFCDTGIANATNDLASARVVRIASVAGATLAEITSRIRNDCELFLYVLHGEMQVRCDDGVMRSLASDDACLVAAGVECAVDVDESCNALIVAIPKR
jgi:quercetin dioxygenase-like cupin family protein